MVSTQSALSVRRQCELLNVCRNRLDRTGRQESAENLEIMRRLDELYMNKPTFGVLRMQDRLRDEGVAINEKRVRRLLRKMGLWAIYPKPNLSRLGQAKYIHPYLLRELEITRPNEVWAIDITYIPMAKGFMYLTAVIDLYSRYVVGWDISNSLDGESSHRVLRKAIARHGKPKIVNSDQGSQFTCKEWVKLLKDEKIGISMDGKGRALDNVFIERLWRSVKHDYVYLHPAENCKELHEGLRTFFVEYNERRHQGIERISPETMYRRMAA
jgi:putative transposase